jgi:hypothetical protein
MAGIEPHRAKRDRQQGDFSVCSTEFPPSAFDSALARFAHARAFFDRLRVALRPEREKQVEGPSAFVLA